MAQSIGQKLTAARKRRDLTIEDVAHETRIRPDTLRHLEADDYSGFDTLTYAKSFLSMYSKHLGIDVSDFLKEFGPANKGGLDQPEYLNGARNGHRDADSLVPVLDAPHRRPILTLIAILVFVSAVPGMYVVGRMHGFQSAKRFTVDKSSQIAAAAIPQRETGKGVKSGSRPAPAPSTESESESESPAVASRRPEVLGDDPPVAMPDTPPQDLVLPPPPADGENVEVRRAAILFEDEEAETGTPAPDDPDRPEVRTAPRAIRLESSN